MTDNGAVSAETVGLRLAIADPPYPPQVSERHDTASGVPRLTTRSRARRYYGDGSQDQKRFKADHHDQAGEPPARSRFAGAKPPRWTRWVLDALGYDQEHDTVADLFPGSGYVGTEISQGVLV